ncbi:MAG: hypothetical protein IJ185_08555 [Prevotella sp.]|nr:hypothetical protein [Prevotella sp.]
MHGILRLTQITLAGPQVLKIAILQVTLAIIPPVHAAVAILYMQGDAVVATVDGI